MTHTNRTGCTAPRHGTYSAYQKAGCRCPDAREDARLYSKRRRTGTATSRRIDATGTIRRIQALQALGHTTATIGATAGRMSGFQVQQTCRRRYVSPTTDTAIRLAYQRLSGVPGTSEITRQRARWWGYAPPLAWEGLDINDPAAVPDVGGCGEHVVDDEAVRRCLRGALRFGQLRPNEQATAYQQLAATGLTGNQIRVRLRINADTVRRLAQAAAELDGAAA